MRKLSPQDLAKHGSALTNVVLSEDTDDSVRRAASAALHQLAAEELAKHASALMRLERRSSYAGEAKAIKDLVVRLASLGRTLAERLASSSAPERNTAAKALGILPWPLLRQYPLSKQHVDALLEWFEEQMLEEKLLPDVFKFPMEEIEQFEGSTWLHLAAARGKSRACRALIVLPLSYGCEG